MIIKIRSLSLAMLVSSLFLAGYAFALEPMETKHLKKISGQASTLYDILDIEIFQKIGEIFYTDDDGIESDGLIGTIFFSDQKSHQTYQTIKDGTDRGGLLHTAYGEVDLLKEHGLSDINYSPLVIDTFGTETSLPGMQNSYTSDTVDSGIKIGLPTIEISTHEKTYTVGIKADGAVNTNREFLKVTRGFGTTAILGGSIAIKAD